MPDKIAVTLEQYETLCWTKNPLRLDVIGVSMRQFNNAWQSHGDAGEDYDTAYRNALLEFVVVANDEQKSSN